MFHHDVLHRTKFLQCKSDGNDSEHDDGDVSFAGTSSLSLWNGTTVSLTATGEIALDTDALSGTTGQGLVLLNDGTTNPTYMVSTTDTPSNGEIPKFDSTLGVIAWSADATGGSPSFDTIASGTNTSDTMIVGSGAEIEVAEGGAVEANEVIIWAQNETGATIYKCAAVHIHAFDAVSGLPDSESKTCMSTLDLAAIAAGILQITFNIDIFGIKPIFGS